MVFTIDAKPYNVEVSFVMGPFNASVRSYYKRVLKCSDELVASIEKGLESAPTTQGRTLHLNNGAVVVWLREVPMGPTYIALLAHEVYHASCFILRNAGMEDGPHTEEAWAYLQQYLLKEALQRVAKKHWK